MTDPLSENAMRRLLAMAGDDAATADATTPETAGLPARYEARSIIGRGGMGIVYEAFDRELSRICAVKRLHARDGGDSELQRRFQREAQSAARLRHPHIATIYDATPDYISMQRIDGVALDAVDANDRRLLVELIRDAARAVHHAHEQGVVHRDLKPSNLLVEGRHIYVVDFGLAKHIEIEQSLSMSGAVLGTPAFMPPEQALAQSDRVDARSDVYALGATLYRCLSGHPPFAADDLPQLLRHVVEDDPAPLRVDRDLDVIVAKCLEKDASRRYESAAALADDLDRWLAGEPVHAQKPSLLYQLRKHLQRRGALVRAASIAALIAIGLTALILVPIMLRQSAERTAASEAVALSAHAAAVQQDALVYTRLGDIDSARASLDSGIERAREFLRRHDVPRVHHLLSQLLRQSGQPAAALDELHLAIAGDPELAEARFERGLMLAALRELDEPTRRQAVEDLEYTPDESSALTDLDRLFGTAERLRLQGDYAQARARLEEVLAYDPTHVQARVSLGIVALHFGEAALALYYSSSAVDLQQGFGPVYFAREQQRLPVAIRGLPYALADFAAQLRDEPIVGQALAHRALVHLRRALRLEAEGDLERACFAIETAILNHDRVLTMHPYLAGAWNNRAVCWLLLRDTLQQHGNQDAALEAARQAREDLVAALTENATLPEAMFNQGTVLLRDATMHRNLGRIAAARRTIDRAQTLLEGARDATAQGWLLADDCRAHLETCVALRTQLGL